MQAWVVYRMERRTSMEVNNFVIFLLRIWKYGEAGGQFTKFPELKAFQPYKPGNKSARHFLQSSEMIPPTSSPTSECVPPLVTGRHTRLQERGMGSQFGRGDRPPPRVPQCLFPRPNWDPPLPLSHANIYPPPPWNQRGGHTRLRVRGSNSDTWRKSQALCLLCGRHCGSRSR